MGVLFLHCVIDILLKKIDVNKIVLKYVPKLTLHLKHADKAGAIYLQGNEVLIMIGVC